METDIIKKYKLNFEIRKREKFPTSINMALTDFLYSWSNIKYINEDLLPFVDEALLGNVDINNCDIGGGGTVAFVEQSTKLCAKWGNVSGYLNPEFELPTIDFKKIIILWRDFLLS